MKKSTVQNAAEKLMLAKLDGPHSPLRRKRKTSSFISFATTTEEALLIDYIVAHATAGDDGVDAKELSMDLCAVNANGCPLDFGKLSRFPTFDFWHDIHGIQRHIDRSTGKLTGFFLPRCTKRTRSNV